MSPTLEIEGKNVDQAVQKACQRLNISQKELQYDILSYGSTGIFGLAGIRKARIRVKTSNETAFAESAGRDAARFETTESSAAAPNANRSLVDETPSELTTPEDKNNCVALGRDVLQRIVDTITDDARINLEERPEKVTFQVEGGNSGILIGRHGQTLEAIQSLIEKVVNKHNSDRIRVQVDVGGYLQNRKNRLIRNAVRMAQKCQRTKKPVTAGLLNAHDRRIVHLALKDNPYVRTRSTGDGVLRNLMILPIKTANSESRKR